MLNIPLFESLQGMGCPGPRETKKQDLQNPGAFKKCLRTFPFLFHACFSLGCLVYSRSFLISTKGVIRGLFPKEVQRLSQVALVLNQGGVVQWTTAQLLAAIHTDFYPKAPSSLCSEESLASSKTNTSIFTILTLMSFWGYQGLGSRYPGKTRLSAWKVADSMDPTTAVLNRSSTCTDFCWDLLSNKCIVSLRVSAISPWSYEWTACY